jgi:hypothetical protein
MGGMKNGKRRTECMLTIGKKIRHHTKALVKIINENGILIYLFAEAGSRSTPGWYDTRVLPHASKEELALPDCALVITSISALLDATICCVAAQHLFTLSVLFRISLVAYFITHGWEKLQRTLMETKHDI